MAPSPINACRAIRRPLGSGGSVVDPRPAASLPRAEADAALTLTEGLAADLEIPLSGYVEANYAAEAKLAEAAELPSAARNRITSLPYKLVLPLLARRIAYAALKVEDPSFARAAACEQQTLQQFFAPDR